MKLAANVLIGQSGGPTVAINASLAGAIRQAMKCEEVSGVYGSLNGLEGVLKQNIIDLRKDIKSDEDFELLQATPAMALGSCRFKLAEHPDATYEKILAILKQYDVGYFFYIGGNDSMDTVKKLSAYFAAQGEDIKCMGIPKTIDNDLPCIDHTPGFGSAAKFIATCVAEVACDSAVYDLQSVTIVEIMGRNAGWLTASAALARRPGCDAPQLIYLPEVPFSPELFLDQIRALSGTVQNIVVAVSEGLRLESGEYVASEQSGLTDAFGHRYLAGVGKYLEDYVRTHLGCKTRSVELNVLQRAASHLYSGVDLREACEIGEAAVRFAVKQGRTGVMAVNRRLSNHPYLVEYDCAQIGQVANLERKVPVEWITPDGNDISVELLEYLRPLVVGEAREFSKDGLPVYFSFDKRRVQAVPAPNPNGAAKIG